MGFDVAFEAGFKALSTKRTEQDVVAEIEYTMKKKRYHAYEF